MTDPDFTAIFNQVHGFLSLAEAELLYRLASEVPANGVIVEIGSYQGRSTVCLGLGAKVNGARVFAVDPHEEYSEGDTHYGMADHAALLKNLVAFDVADVVRVIALRSNSYSWSKVMDLVFIDGSHEYIDVRADINECAPGIRYGGKIIMHDASGLHPGVTQALNEILAAGQWRISEQVDAAAVLVRVK